MTEPKKRGLKPGMTNNPNGAPKRLTEETVQLGIRVPISLKPKCIEAVEKILARHKKNSKPKK